MKKLSALVIVIICCSHANSGLQNDTDDRGQTSGATSSVSSGSAVSGSSGGGSIGSSSQASGVSGAAIGQSNPSSVQQPSAGRSSGRQIAPLKPLRTVTGSMPGFMQRAASRMSQQASQPLNANGNLNNGGTTSGTLANQGSFQIRGQQNQSTANSNTQQSLQQVFLNNAMSFDGNSDNQLAANELKNLFLLLVSENTQNNYYGFNSGFGLASGVQIGRYANFNQANQSQFNQGFNQVQPQGVVQTPNISLLLSGGVPNIDSSSLQEAILLFLLLTLQFDTDGDGALNQAEIQRFALALLNNEFNLASAANQTPQLR